MEIKVKAVEDIPQKSRAQVEEELLQKHEENISSEDPKEKVTIEETKTEVVENSTKPDFGEEQVLSFIKDRYDKEINSLNDLFEQKNNNEDLPADVKSYLDYKKETGRSYDDYMALNRDFSKENPESVLFNYYSQNEPDLTKDEVQFLIDSKFKTDENVDSETAIKQKGIEKKKEISKALKYFEEQKSKYKSPVESTEDTSFKSSDDYKAYLEYKKETLKNSENIKRRSENFKSKTNDLFGEEFKGFKFNIEDKDYVFTPGDRNELNKAQSDISNFLNKFTNEQGELSDVNGYHRSLALAMNPDKFAKYFYDAGKSEALDNQNKKMKNIDLKMRSAPESTSKQGLKIKAMTPTSRRGLVIKSNKT
tara:strand:+ start:1018 stop:2112 length:1095 start_codon:yes stop_codon:yes gene_type:complete